MRIEKINSKSIKELSMELQKMHDAMMKGIINSSSIYKNLKGDKPKTCATQKHDLSHCIEVSACK